MKILVPCDLDGLSLYHLIPQRLSPVNHYTCKSKRRFTVHSVEITLVVTGTLANDNWSRRHCAPDTLLNVLKRSRNADRVFQRAYEIEMLYERHGVASCESSHCTGGQHCIDPDSAPAWPAKRIGNGY